MALVYKNNTSNNFGSATAWDVLPTSTAAATIGSAANPLTTSPWTTGGTMSTASLWLSSDYTASSTFSITTTFTNGPIISTYGPTAANTSAGAKDYSVYVEAGKTLSFAGQIRFYSTRPSEPISTHKVWVGSGGNLLLNEAGSTTVYGYLSADSSSTVTIEKWGPGLVYTGRLNVPGTTDNATFIIVDGTIQLDGATGSKPLGATTTPVTFDPRGNAGYTPTLKWIVGNGSFTTPSRTLANPIVVNERGTIDVGNGFTATMSGATSGSGTLTVSTTGTGSLVWSNTLSVPINVTGSLSMASTNNLTGSVAMNGGTVTMNGGVISGAISGASGTITTNNGNITSPTITGAATLAMGSGSLGSSSSVNASGHTGTISGNCSISGGTSSFGSNFTGTLSSVSGTSVIFTGASAGAIAGITANTAVLSGGTFAASSGATALSGGTNVRILTGGGFNSGRSLTLTGSSKLTLGSSASVANAVSDTDTTTATIQCEDATTCTYSGTYSTTQTSGTVAVRATTSGGILVLSGTLSGTQAGRTFAVNNTASDTGTVKVTGAGFSGASLVTVSYGKLHLNSNSAIGLGGGLTVNPGGTVACSSTVAYAASLTGNVTLAAGSTFKFASA